MKSFAILAACFVSVEAWQVVLYAEGGCSGPSYGLANQMGCRRPGGVPASFDAKSVQFIDVPTNLNVFTFTDNNNQCNHQSSQGYNWIFWSGDGAGVTTCHALDPNKNGKYQNILVESNSAARKLAVGQHRRPHLEQ